jgi:hypothetical protein
MTANGTCDPLDPDNDCPLFLRINALQVYLAKHSPPVGGRLNESGIKRPRLHGHTRGRPRKEKRLTTD